MSRVSIAGSVSADFANIGPLTSSANSNPQVWDLKVASFKRTLKELFRLLFAGPGKTHVWFHLMCSASLRFAGILCVASISIARRDLGCYTTGKSHITLGLFAAFIKNQQALETGMKRGSALQKRDPIPMLFHDCQGLWRAHWP